MPGSVILLVFELNLYFIIYLKGSGGTRACGPVNTNNELKPAQAAGDRCGSQQDWDANNPLVSSDYVFLS